MRRRFFWLSFIDPARPTGEQFLGAAIVGPAQNLVQAIKLAHVAGCNPGGNVIGVPLPKELAKRLSVDDLNRLLDTTDCDEFDKRMGIKS